ncbi:hypothetical protein GQ55_7G290000 [Panicum hallii var. hallii]|uniref:Uncharacterized protein n=1 Tax=Panicum hallii var. hallii TaxID=1504633 RepID=A0A2T7D066_9POAL|nr:hypothetical protein GQ55_7G290000 [Panicum hallii var. hallii]
MAAGCTPPAQTMTVLIAAAWITLTFACASDEYSLRKAGQLGSAAHPSSAAGGRRPCPAACARARGSFALPGKF